MAYLFFVLFLFSLFSIWDHPKSVSHWLISLGLFACWMVVGKQARNKRTTSWHAATRLVRGTYVDTPADAVLQQFGHAPWHTWARATALRAQDTISGTDRQRAFWLLEMQHKEWSLSQPGFTGAWYPTSFAIVRLAGEPTGELRPLPVTGGLKAMHNGGYLFVWVNAWGDAVGKSLPPHRLPGLLKVALDLAAQADRVPPAQPAKTDAPPERRRRSAEADRAIPVLVLLAWAFIVGVFFLPRELSALLLTLPALVLSLIGLDLKRVGSTCHFAVLAGCILAATLRSAQGFLFIPLGFAAIIFIDWFASSKNTHRDRQGRLLWGHRDDA